MPIANSIEPQMARLVLQLAMIVIFAKTFGYIVSRYMKQPSVLGEIIAGMLIGPYALGSIPFSFLDGNSLFIIPSSGTMPISSELYGVATMASIVLLFISGLKTDLKIFLRFAGIGALVGFGGTLITFFLGAGSAVIFLPDVHGLLEPKALFMGIITATSIGVTARILSEQNKLTTPEGVTILSAAVLDDVLGIILLAIIVALTRGEGNSHTFDWFLLGRIVLRAVGFWLGSTVIGIFLAPRLTRSLKKLWDMDFLAIFAIGVALFLAGLSEMAGLAMVIGAYVTGLAFSNTDVAEIIRQRLEDLYDFIVPIFFCVMGMLVDFSIIPDVLGYGLLYAFLAILGKLIGAGGFSFFGGFNLRGALRIGAGMVPRGEVTLIVAGLGLSMGIMDTGLFGVAVITMFLSSLITPPMLRYAFKGGSGFMGKVPQGDIGHHRVIALSLPNISLVDFLLPRLLLAFQQSGYFPRRVNNRKPVYTIRKDAIQLSLYCNENTITINVPPDQENFVRLLFMEEILSLKNLFQRVGDITNSDSLERGMMSNFIGSSKYNPA